MRRRPSLAAWGSYLRQFHRERPGITEAVLGRCRLDGQTPYEWFSHGVAGGSFVLDLACGSAPTRGLAGDGWVGLDASRAELAAAGPDAIGRVVQGDLCRLPVRTDACDTIICSMALMLIEPVGEALREIRRVLHAGGALRLLLPARAATTARDRARYALLASTVGTVTLFPPGPLLRRPASCLEAAGLCVVTDDTARFAYPIRGHDDAVRLIDSLYLPGLGARRRQAACRLVARWHSTDLGIPLRRITAVPYQPD